MADNYLITGYWGEPHVTAENDRGINAAMFGTGRFVLPVGEQFKAEYIGNNTVRMYDGKLMDNGAAAGIPAGEYVDLLIPEAGQGMNRNDLIIFQYSLDASTLIERGVFMVLSGEETSGAATDPVLSQQDILTNEATLDQMALWRIPVSGTVISSPVQLFEVSKNLKNAGSTVVEATSSDGVAYSATVPGVTELYAGLEITIIPKVVSASTAITLDVNGLGAKFVRLPLSTNTAILVQPSQESFFVDNRPVKLIYDDKYASKGSWVVVGRQRPSGNDLYGSVPVQCGGIVIDNNTTDEDKSEALENLNALGAMSMELLWENASPESEFAAQTVQIPLSGYDFALIYVYDANKAPYDADGLVGFIIPVGKSGTLTTVNYQITYRKAVVATSSVTFTKALYIKTLNEAGSDAGKRCIPHYIYGIKGVSA